MANLVEAANERNGGKPVEDGVDEGQRSELGAGDVGGRVVVDQPADECTGGRGDENNSHDDAGWSAEGRRAIQANRHRFDLIVLEQQAASRVGHHEGQ